MKFTQKEICQLQIQVYLEGTFLMLEILALGRGLGGLIFAKILDL